MESKHVPGIAIVSIDEPIDYMVNVKLARQMSPSDNMMLGLEMFDQACADIRAKILVYFPDAPAEAVDEMLELLVERTRRI